MDRIPVLSQLKSLGLAVAGDHEAALAVQQKFANTCPIVSQVTSAVHAAAGNNDLATEVQLEFLGTIRDTILGTRKREETSSESFPHESVHEAHPACKEDRIPVLSQLKSLCHALEGDMEKAEAVQQHFIRRCPIVSQVTSAVYAIQGNHDLATEVQLEFLRTMRDELLGTEESSGSTPHESLHEAHPGSICRTDWTPVLSQLKSLCHAVEGDMEKAEAAQQIFIRRCPIVSQVTSAVYAILGNHDLATEVQLEFLRTMLDELLGTKESSGSTPHEFLHDLASGVQVEILERRQQDARGISGLFRRCVRALFVPLSSLVFACLFGLRTTLNHAIARPKTELARLRFWWGWWRLRRSQRLRWLR